MTGTNDEHDAQARTRFRNILVQLLEQPVEIVEGDELEIKGWCKDEKEFAEKLVESACCIANAKGGAVLAGVEGKRATFSLCPHRNVDATWIELRMKDQSYPPVECQVFDLTELLAEVRGTAGATVFGILIPPKTFLTSHVTSKGISKIRKGRECRPYFTTADDDRTRTIVGGVSTSDLSQESIKWAISRHEKKFGIPLLDKDPLSFLARMRLIVPLQEGFREMSTFQVTLAALLLFGKDRALQRTQPSVETIVAVGTDRHLVSHNVVESIRELVISEKSPLRERCENVSQEMLVELLMNAYIHRCWRTPGPVMVLINGVLEIQSPGELMPGLNVNNLLHCIPCYRNFLLAESSRHIGLCDKLGKGIGLIFHSALKGGLEIPTFESGDNAFTARLSVGRSETFREFVRVRSSTLSNMDEILTLRALLDRRDMSLAELAQVLQRGIEQTQMVVQAMEKKMMVEPVPTDRFMLAWGVRRDIETIYQVNQLDLFQG